MTEVEWDDRAGVYLFLLRLEHSSHLVLCVVL